MAAVASKPVRSITVRVEHHDGTWNQCVVSNVRECEFSVTPLVDMRAEVSLNALVEPGVMELSEGDEDKDPVSRCMSTGDPGPGRDSVIKESR